MFDCKQYCQEFAELPIPRHKKTSQQLKKSMLNNWGLISDASWPLSSCVYIWCVYIRLFNLFINLFISLMLNDAVLTKTSTYLSYQSSFVFCKSITCRIFSVSFVVKTWRNVRERSPKPTTVKVAGNVAKCLPIGPTWGHDLILRGFRF